MKLLPLCLFLLAAVRGFAAPEFIQNDARRSSYARLIPSRPEPAFVDADQQRIIRLLAKHAATPVVPDEVIPENQIAEIVFGAKPVNRPPEFGAEDFLALWKNARLEAAAGNREISLAPDNGFLVLKDGQTVPVDLYGMNAIGLSGFLFRKP